MIKLVYLMLISTLIFTGCETVKEEVKKEKKPAIILGPEKVTVYQLRSVNLDMLGEDVYLKLGDISRGQVPVTIVEGDTTVLRMQVMKEKDTLFFNYLDTPLSIRLLKLHNFLVGDDYADFIIDKDNRKIPPEPAIEGPKTIKI